MTPKQREELLKYYWEGEPVYHPTKGATMPDEKVLLMKVLAGLLLVLYITFSFVVFRTVGPQPIWIYLASLPAAAFLADFMSGLSHIYIDFGSSNRKNILHKQLFLSRVHHHELTRPAKLGYPSLWYYPAFYSFLTIAVVPSLILFFKPSFLEINSLAPFWLGLLWFSSISQVSHAFAHGKAKHPISKKLVQFLQRIRLFLSPKAHGKHHREIDRNFCVLNGWANPLINVIFKCLIESRLSETTRPDRQKSDMKKNLSYPYEEIL